MILFGIIICGVFMGLILAVSIALFVFWVDDDNYHNCGCLISSIVLFILFILLGFTEYKLISSESYIYYTYQSRINAIEKAEKDLQKFYIDYPQYKDLKEIDKK